MKRGGYKERPKTTEVIMRKRLQKKIAKKQAKKLADKLEGNKAPKAKNSK